MKIEELEDLLVNHLDLITTKNPHIAFLTKEMLECWATIKDNEVNNSLLQDLVFRYAKAEKKLVALNQELLEKQKRIEEDLAAAAEIQKSLLPKETGGFEKFNIAWYFEPCEHIGGDILNIIQLDDHLWAIYVLDVSGHGVPAAMLAVSVSQLLQPYTGYLMKKRKGKASKIELKNPAEVLNLLDREYPFERFNNFFTISYVILDTANNTLQYSNAGHPPPILQRSDGSLELLTQGGHSIGMGSFKTARKGKNFFGEESLALHSGDKLFVYSDGITEYQNRSGGFFGNDRLFRELKELNHLPVSETVDTLIKTIKTFGGDLKPQDDVTLLGLQIT